MIGSQAVLEIKFMFMFLIIIYVFVEERRSVYAWISARGACLIF